MNVLKKEVKINKKVHGKTGPKANFDSYVNKNDIIFLIIIKFLHKDIDIFFHWCSLLLVNTNIKN